MTSQFGTSTLVAQKLKDSGVRHDDIEEMLKRPKITGSAYCGVVIDQIALFRRDSVIGLQGEVKHPERKIYYTVRF